MVNELNAIQRKALLSIRQVQLVAFCLSLLGILTTYFILTFAKPVGWWVLVLVFFLWIAIFGLTILVRMWWHLTIKKELLNSNQILKVIGQNLVYTLALVLTWLLWINHLLGIPVLIIVASVLWVYTRWVNNWGTFSKSFLAKKRETSI